PNPSRERAHREYASLFPDLRTPRRPPPRTAGRVVTPRILEPLGAIRVVAALAGGVHTPRARRPDVDDADITAALGLFPKARAEMDQLEALFLGIARQRGMTWREIAFGLDSAAPKRRGQRYERLVERT
ncbi:DNA-binding protein, partial [Rhodococcus hoagii]|nr:DNA-binding protein [Prescottella equi]